MDVGTVQPPNYLEEKIEVYCRAHHLVERGEKIVIGVSGGPDSVCLLALLRVMAPTYDLQLHIAHLNHALRGQAAADDAAYVTDLARRWELPVTIEKEDVATFAKQNKLNLEDAARRRRYAFLARIAARVGAAKVAVGHNANDQAETVLMHFLRGAGVSGLRGMRPRAILPGFYEQDSPPPNFERADLILIRPLLETARVDIERYCQAHALSPRRDASNLDSTLLRNRLRHQLLPLLQSYNPNIYQALARTASLMAADYRVLQQQVDRAWGTLLISQTETVVRFDLPGWQGQPLAVQRGLLRRAVQTLGQSLSNIEFIHIEQGIRLLQKGRTNTRLELPGRLTLAVDYDGVTFISAAYIPPTVDWPHLISPELTISVKVPGETALPNTGWSLHCTLLDGSNLSEAGLKQDDPWQGYFDLDRLDLPLILRGRQPGDRFSPLGLKGHRQRLKRFMINQKIPPLERERIPLLVSSEGGTIYWVCGRRPAHQSRVTTKTRRVLWASFRKRLGD